MIHLIPCACRLSLLIAPVVLLANATWAAPVFQTAQSGPFTPSTTTDEVAFAADVSNSDLLHGIVGTGGSWMGGTPASPAGLNDGLAGGDFDAVGLPSLNGAAWAMDGNNVSFREFVLGSGANGLGFDITEVQSISAWQGAGFQNQKYTISVRYLGDPSYTPLTTVDFQPSTSTAASNAQGGSAKVNVTDDAGLLASGIDAIRFDILDTVSSNAGGVVMREIDVFGSATSGGPDVDPPTLDTLTSVVPPDGATDVPLAANPEATFSEPITLTGAGSITLKNLSGGADIPITLPGDVSISGAVLTINPATDLVSGQEYAVEIGSDAIEDLAGNPYAGLLATDTPNWSFTAALPDTTPPTLDTLTDVVPADDATDVEIASDLEATFSEPMALTGVGSITLKNLSGGLDISITLPGDVSISGAVLTINPATDLVNGQEYTVEISSDAIEDLAGNPYAGLLGTDTPNWTFTATTDAVSQVSSTTQFVYAADASASDLLHGLTPVITGWNTVNEASPLELTDGIHGVGFNQVPGDRVQGAWTTVGATAEYDLGLSPGGTGWDITSVQSIADWVNVGFGNQSWTIEVKPVGGSYTVLATVDYQPLGNGGGTTKVTLTDPSGILATGIEFIKVTANQVNGGANAGAFVWRELDVFGVPTNDENPPILDTLSSVIPADGTTDVPLSSSLEATFSEPVALTGVGSITLKNLSGGSDIPVSLPGDVSISGAVLTINPAANLAAGTEYAVEISSDSLEDLAGNPYAGLLATDTPNWSFTTGQPDLTGPTLDILTSVSPAGGATSVPLAANLVATFSEPVALTGNGSITLKNLSGGADIAITLPGGVSISGAVLTINPPSNLVAQQEYAVEISSDAIEDLAGNPYAGLLAADTPNWSFTAATVPLRIMCLGDSITVGYTDNPSWANHPFMFGYRSGLYTRLSNAGYNFLFVGASTEPWTGISGDPTYGGIYKPALDLRDFGQDGHRGYGGAGIWSNVNTWIDADDPDIILLLIGINGISTGSPAALNTLLNNIVTHAPDVHVIVAQITPRVSFNQALYDYNVYIRDTLVPNYAANGHKVSTVDLYSFFLTDPSSYTTLPSTPSAIAPGVLSNNINHPDNPHYDLMAQEWFEGIESLGIGPTFNSWISNYPGVGAQIGINDDPDGDGIDNGVENFFGTAPDAFTRGLVPGVVDRGSNTFTFSHPLNANPADDLTAVYRWSTDLQNFYIDGDSNGAGTTTVTFSDPTPTGDLVSVTATITGTVIPNKLFVDVEVTQP